LTDDYKLLIEIWKKEKNSRGIQPLPEDFLNQVAAYLIKLKEQTQQSDTSSFIEKILEKEKVHADKLINNLWEIRLNKIVKAELNGFAIEPLNLTNEEKRLQVELRRLIAAYTQGIKQILLGREQKQELVQQVTSQPPLHIPQVEKQETILKVVRFLQPLPAIMGVDLKTYGPFKTEDVASIPAPNAENLIRKGIAKWVETDQ
jgi:DNA replication initiation complex subunit (GINS family)